MSQESWMSKIQASILQSLHAQEARDQQQRGLRNVQRQNNAAKGRELCSREFKLKPKQNP